jgi:hypothetical protein
MSRILLRETPENAEAAVKLAGLGGRTVHFDVKDTLGFMRVAGLSTTALGNVKHYVSEHDVGVTMASLPKVREAIHALSIPVVIRESMLATGPKAEVKEVMCLVSRP